MAGITGGNMSIASIPVVSTTASQGHPTVSNTLNTLIHDLFLSIVVGASLFVKSPATQQQASALITLANNLINEHFPPATT